MEELQYMENETKAFNDNAITKGWCGLKVKVEDWELCLLEDIHTSYFN